MRYRHAIMVALCASSRAHPHAIGVAVVGGDDQNALGAPNGVDQTLDTEVYGDIARRAARRSPVCPTMSPLARLRRTWSHCPLIAATASSVISAFIHGRSSKGVSGWDLDVAFGASSSTPERCR